MKSTILKDFKVLEEAFYQFINGYDEQGYTEDSIRFKGIYNFLGNKYRVTISICEKHNSYHKSFAKVEALNYDTSQWAELESIPYTLMESTQGYDILGNDIDVLGNGMSRDGYNAIIKDVERLLQTTYRLVQTHPIMDRYTII